MIAGIEKTTAYDILLLVKQNSRLTLILGGAEDRIVGMQASYELKEQIAGSELYVYPGLRYAAYEEAKNFNDRVLSFLMAK